MTKLFLLTVLACGVASFAQASAVPEINPGMAGNALAILAGVGLVIRSRRKR